MGFQLKFKMAVFETRGMTILVVLFGFLAKDAATLKRIPSKGHGNDEIYINPVHGGQRSDPKINFLFDWKSILAPCKGNMTWQSKTDREIARSMRTNAKHTKIITENIRVDESFSSVVIQTYTLVGHKKYIGGDSWRASVTGTCNQFAIVRDNMDGTYEILFRIYEKGIYSLELHLEQSMCDGLRDPPSGWFEKGNMQGHLQSPNVLGNIDDFILEKVTFAPFEVKHIKKVTSNQRNLCPRMKFCQRDGWKEQGTRPESNDSCPKTVEIHLTTNKNECGLVWESLGRWKYLNGRYHWLRSQPMDKQRPRRNSKKFHTLWIYGDSISQRWWDSRFRRVLCRHLFKFCTHTYTFTYAQRNFNKSQIDFGHPFNKSRFLNPINKVLTDPRMKTERSTLVINFGIHLILNLNFTDLKDTVDKFAELIESKQKAKQPLPKIIWRSTTSTIPEAKKLRNTVSARFLTNHRIRLFNAYANSRLCSTGIDIFDVFTVTASYPKGCSDGVHFLANAFNYPNQAFEFYLRNCFA